MGTSTHNLCFEQKYEKYQIFLYEICHFLVVKFSVYLNRRVFVMQIRYNVDVMQYTACLVTAIHCMLGYRNSFTVLFNWMKVGRATDSVMNLLFCHRLTMVL